MEIEKQYDQIARCNRCGFCQVACPIFRTTGHEAGVARGRIALLRALVEKRIEWSRELEEPLFNCLLCGACTANCFPAIETADLVRDARSEYLDRVGRNLWHRLLFDRLLPYPKRLRRAARAVALGKRSGLSKVARALGLLRVFGRDFPRAEAIVARFPPKAFRDEVEPGVIQGAGKLRIGYFVGCGMDIMCPEAAQATLRFLRRIGETVHVLDNCCCGLPAATYGDRRAAQSMAERNMALFGQGGFDTIITDCSSCAAFLKSYPKLFAEDDPRRAAAETHASRVRDLVELLASSEAPPSMEDRGLKIEDRKPSSYEFSTSGCPSPGERIIATYHDPCHASRGQGITRQPREILRRAPGIEYRELAEADWCCGGAGSYALAHYELSRQVLNRKIDHVERSGANLLVTSCPACIVHLRYGVRTRGLPVRVCHISEVV
jgi:glycolate oxidase iron-sulfur subunit